MHEVAIVHNLLSAAREAAAGSGINGRVSSLTLSVGKLSCASPEALRTAFDILSAGTSFEGAKLIIETPPGLCRCRGCGAQTEASDYFASCSRCGSNDVSIEGGEELVLRSMDVEEEGKQE